MTITDTIDASGKLVRRELQASHENGQGGFAFATFEGEKSAVVVGSGDGAGAFRGATEVEAIEELCRKARYAIDEARRKREVEAAA